MSVAEFSRSPEPNNAATKLAFIRASDRGNSLWELDLPAGTPRMVERKEQARRLFDWSPDDRYLLLKDFDSDETLMLYDSVAGSLRPTKPGPSSKGKDVTWLATAGQVAWLSPNRFAYVGNDGGNAKLRLANLDGTEKGLLSVSPPRARDLLARMTPQKLALVSNRELWSFDVSNSQATQITTNLSQDYLWLRYSEESNAFLYCSEDDSDWRHLYRLDLSAARDRKVTQLTFGPEHTYNGQWIERGKGFVYVASLTNHFHLAVRTQDPALSTNLFSGGYLYGYRVAADGNRIYAVASLGPEPCGTWEYDIAARRLRCLVPGAEPFKVSKIIPAVEAWAKSFDGLSIPYYRREPKDFRPDLKYPLVIAIPHRDGMFDWSWEKYSQFLANIGIIHLSANVRGSDGYGRTYRENQRDQADKDVLAVRKAALRTGNVDEKRIFLMAHSSGGEIVTKLALEHPELWAGVILFGPSLTIPPKKPASLPHYFIFMGENDAGVSRAREFENWAHTNGVQVTMWYDQRAAHFITDVNLDKKLGLALSELIFGRKYSASATGRSQTD